MANHDERDISWQNPRPSEEESSPSEGHLVHHHTEVSYAVGLLAAFGFGTLSRRSERVKKKQIQTQNENEE